MNDRVSVDVVDGGQDAVLKFLLGCDADRAEHGTRQLGEEPLYEIEPGAVLGREHEVKRSSRWRASQALVSLEMWAE